MSAYKTASATLGPNVAFPPRACDFYDFGSKNCNFNAIIPVSVSSNLHTIIVGLNYRFNWSGGPQP